MKSTFFVRGLGLVLAIVLCSTIPAQGATLSGTVVFKGKAPEPVIIDMSEVEECAIKHSAPVFKETLVLGKGQTLANVFVSVKSGLSKKEYPVPTDPMVLDQAGCRYSPHVFGIRAGQPLKILNPDGTLHNIHAMPKVNQEFNMAMPKFKKTAIKKFDKKESVFPIKCDVHSWMGAWCVVMDHPFFNVSKKDGKFTIKDLEAGTYEIEAWHEKLGTQSATITVSADEAKTLDFSFSSTDK